MADKKTVLTQETLNKAQKIIDRLIDLCDTARIEACNSGMTELRDKLERTGAHLRMGRAEAGSLDLGGGIRPLSGGK